MLQFVTRNSTRSSKDHWNYLIPANHRELGKKNFINKKKLKEKIYRVDIFCLSVQVYF